MQTIYSCKEQLPNISIQYISIGREGGIEREGERKCIAERKYYIYIIYIYHVFFQLLFWGISFI